MTPCFDRGAVHWLLLQVQRGAAGCDRHGAFRGLPRRPGYGGLGGRGLSLCRKHAARDVQDGQGWRAGAPLAPVCLRRPAPRPAPTIVMRRPDRRSAVSAGRLTCQPVVRQTPADRLRQRLSWRQLRALRCRRSHCAALRLRRLRRHHCTLCVFGHRHDPRQGTFGPTHAGHSRCRPPNNTCTRIMMYTLINTCWLTLGDLVCRTT